MPQIAGRGRRRIAACVAVLSLVPGACTAAATPAAPSATVAAAAPSPPQMRRTQRRLRRRPRLRARLLPPLSPLRRLSRPDPRPPRRDARHEAQAGGAQYPVRSCDLDGSGDYRIPDRLRQPGRRDPGRACDPGGFRDRVAGLEGRHRRRPGHQGLFGPCPPGRQLPDRLPGPPEHGCHAGSQEDAPNPMARAGR